MNLTSAKGYAEILDALQGENKVFVLACGGCPVGAETVSAAKVDEMCQKLGEAGKAVTGKLQIDFLCNKSLVSTRLRRKMAALKQSESMLVMSCGVGVQATAALVDIPARAALNTVSVHGVQGIWPSEERCAQCGDCVLNYTAGICPMTGCAKHLLNGACGGSHKGKCEVSPDRDCGWYLIYDRLTKLGQTNRLKKLFLPKDARTMDIPDQVRTALRWALEVDEELEAKKAAERAAAAAAPKKKKKAK
ncbi:MAG: hypothetical protein FJ279_11170 [Planctomycetes bacterium]|nr:hypothetical protein [Planctomycetota bacterium]